MLHQNQSSPKFTKVHTHTHTRARAQCSRVDIQTLSRDTKACVVCNACTTSAAYKESKGDAYLEQGLVVLEYVSKQDVLSGAAWKLRPDDTAVG
jgi:hypothetical protein